MIYRKLRPPSPPSYYSRISLSLVKRVRFLFLCFFFLISRTNTTFLCFPSFFNVAQWNHAHASGSIRRTINHRIVDRNRNI